MGIGREADQKAHNFGYRLLRHTIHERFGLVPALDLLVLSCLNSSMVCQAPTLLHRVRTASLPMEYRKGKRDAHPYPALVSKQ